MTSPLRLLLWLKWTLTWRGYRRSRSKVVGAIIQILVFLPLSGFSAYGLWLLDQGSPNLFVFIARDTLTILYFLWVVTPLLGFSLNESFDPTRLFIYPITLPRLFLGGLLGGLLDRGVLLVLPIMILLIGLSSPTLPALLLSIAMALLFLLQAIAFGQALMLLLIGFLRSRRFRDLTIVLFPLIGMSIYLGQRLFFRQLEAENVSLPAMIQAHGWRYAVWLPSGWAALGLDAARRGAYGTAIIALALLCAATGAATAVAVIVLKTVYAGEAGPNHPQRAQATRRASSQRSRQLIMWQWLPESVSAMAGKEFLALYRDPQYKALAVQSVYTLIWLAASLVLPSLHQGDWTYTTGPWLLFEIASALLLSMLPLLFNIWAGEGAALSALFSLPSRRIHMLIGKNLAHGFVLLVICGLGLSITAVFSHASQALPSAAAWVLLTTPLLLAAGNLVSIRFPHRMLVRGQRWGRGGIARAEDDTGSGCAYSALYIAAYAAAFITVLPVLAAVLLPGSFGIAKGWYTVSLPCAALYSAALYVILLRQAEVWLMAREPEIIARIAPPS